ncbi:MAG: prepilin-type cleavage/methylation domain-containing protein [Terracidiphilus sp.]
MPPLPSETGRTPPPPPAGAARPVPVFVWVLVGLAVGFIPIVLILALVIPTIGSMKKRANEAAAIQTIRAIYQAQLQYQDTYPANGYACALTALGGDPGAGPPSATAAQILQPDMTSGFKSGYIFAISNCTKETVKGADLYTGFVITAVPQKVGKTGNRGFCDDQFGTITYDPDGGANCTRTFAR